jgi:hypothetical protein
LALLVPLPFIYLVLPGAATQWTKDVLSIELLEEVEYLEVVS